MVQRFEAPAHRRVEEDRGVAQHVIARHQTARALGHGRQTAAKPMVF
jgi:hypothetical protein